MLHSHAFVRAYTPHISHLLAHSRKSSLSGNWEPWERGESLGPEELRARAASLVGPGWLHACARVRVGLPGVWDLAVAASWKDTPTLFTGKQRPEQSSWAWEVGVPTFRAFEPRICVVLGTVGPDKDRVRARLSWERACCEAPDPFLSQIRTPEQRREGTREEGGQGQAHPHHAGLEGRRGPQQIQRFIDTQECGVTRKQPRDPDTGPGADGQGGQAPSSLHPDQTLCSRSPGRCGARLRVRKARSPDG